MSWGIGTHNVIDYFSRNAFPPVGQIPLGIFNFIVLHATVISL